MLSIFFWVSLLCFICCSGYAADCIWNHVEAYKLSFWHSFLHAARALELFLQDLIDRTYEITLQSGAKTLNSFHLWVPPDILIQ
jgi:hypothetical protein